VRQLKDRVISNDTKDEIFGVPYKERAIEIEANTIASSIISEFGEFEREIARLLLSNEQLDNNKVAMLIDMYYKRG